MRKKISFDISNLDEFRNHLVAWASHFDVFTILDSNNDKPANQKNNKYSSFDLIAGIGLIDNCDISSPPFSSLKKFVDTTHDWKFGHFGYDLKEYTENIPSIHPDHIGFPILFFFRPQWVILCNNKTVELHYPDSTLEFEAKEVIKNLTTAITQKQSYIRNGRLKCRIEKEEYLSNVTQLQKRIYRGDIYEINYCIDFYGENYLFDPYSKFLILNSYSCAPFSAFYKYFDKFLLCSSPERYLKKTGSKIVSQPIKGTIARDIDELTDHELLKKLKENPKERAENIMTTDLVRNDLSRSAKTGTVLVEELCGVYSFAHVHQLITTIVYELDNKVHFIDSVQLSFPMGSMTGAPKINTLKLIDKYEKVNRGLFSGSVGYISPTGDFDFNVVIRSILYNHSTKYIDIFAGSAITAYSEPEKEFDECLLKIRSLLNVLEMKS
jgi:para-aminobenzoate synthetase component I